MTDYTELKRLAEAAKNDKGDYVALNDYGMAVPPAVVRELIADLERNQRMLLAACMDMGAIGNALDADMNSDGEALLEMVVELKAERETAQSLIGAVVIASGAALGQDLCEVLEALRKDAARYRWLNTKSTDGPNICVSEWVGPHEYPLIGDELDAAVDAAMGKGEQS